MDKKNIIEVDESNFLNEVIEKSESQLIVVDFWAPWCGPCKQLTPVLEKVINNANGKAILAKINLDENQQIAAQLKIQSIPTVLAFKNKQIVNAFQGVIPEKKIIEFIEKCLGEKLEEDFADFFKEIENLAPFGSANIEPKFVVEDIKVINSNIIADKHIKSLLCGKDGTVFKSIYFNGNNTRFADILSKDYKKNFNIAGRLSLNEWKGKKNIEFVIEDIAIK